MITTEGVPLRVELDAELFALFGWEFDWFRAELVTEKVRPSERLWIHKVSAQGNIRRFPAPPVLVFGPRYRFRGSGDVPPMVWQLRSGTRGAFSGYEKIQAGLFVKWIRSLSVAWVSATLHDPNDLYVWVGAADWAEVDEWSRASVSWAEIPVELADETTHSAIGSVARELTARIRDNESLEVTLTMVHPLGGPAELRAMAMQSERFAGYALEEGWVFEVDAPDITIDIFGATGVVLDSRKLDNDRWVQIEAAAKAPPRHPILVVATTKPLGDLSDSPARVLVSLTDSLPRSAS